VEAVLDRTAIRDRVGRVLDRRTRPPAIKSSSGRTVRSSHSAMSKRRSLPVAADAGRLGDLAGVLPIQSLLA